MPGLSLPLPFGPSHAEPSASCQGVRPRWRQEKGWVGRIRGKMREWRPWRARKEETGECGTCVHEECAPGCDGSIAAEGSLHALGKGERASSNTTKRKPQAKFCGGGR